MWKKDGQTLENSGSGYAISTVYSDYMDATTSLMLTDTYLSRSFEGVYCVIISNINNVIPETQRTANYTFQINVTGESPLMLYGIPW